MNELAKTITLKIKRNDYDCPFPNCGQLIDIENYKANLSKGQYRNLVNNMTLASLMSLDYIDCIATFSILIPKLFEDLRVPNIFLLDLISMKEIVDVFKKEYLPWYNQWMDVISGKEDKKEE
jgi:hypothetical protein